MRLEIPADLTNQPVVWTPDESAIVRSRMLAFAGQHDLDSYDALVKQATAEPSWFWEAVTDHLGIEWKTRYDSVLDLSGGNQWPKWFAGGRMNYVTSAIDRYLPHRSSTTALIWEGDDGRTESQTFAELAENINRFSNALRALGVEKGDRVGIFLPMLPETAVAMLACGKIGAVFIPIFSGYGADATAGRLAEAGATVLITADGFFRRGRVIPMKPTADLAVVEVESLKHVVVVRHTGEQIEMKPDRDVWWHEVVADSSTVFQAADTAADDPFMIIFTSGTTGRPKGAVHTHSGFPIKAAQDLAFCFDLHDHDRLCWITDLGWMMGPWLIAGGLIAGGTLVLYEGTPDYPEPDRLWQLVERHDVNVLGVAPTAMRALMARGDHWAEQHEMPSLNAIGSTGEPWNPDPWIWTLEKVGKGRCPIINYSGGTEIGGGIISSTTIHPLKPCSFVGPIPGVPADVVDESGQSVRQAVGELAIRGPWVGMTNGFWKDPERYLDTYWSRFDDIWIHGDWSYIDDDGYWYILGRSDDTMNIAGKRVGPAEVESAAVAHPAVQEAAAIGVPHEIKGESIVVFVVLNPDAATGMDEESLSEEILDGISSQLGRPLRPERIVVVDDLPRTRNAKIMRRLIRGRYLNESDLGDLSALENPSAIEAIIPATKMDDQ